MSSPNRPKRPSARPKTRPEPAVHVTVTGLPEGPKPATSKPEDTTVSAKPNERPPRVSARRSAPTASTAPEAPAPAASNPSVPSASGDKNPARASTKKPKSVHTAQTVVPKMATSAGRAKRVRDTAGKHSLPDAPDAAAVSASAQASATVRAPSLDGAAQPRAPTPPTERPSKGRASRGSRPENEPSALPSRPGVQAVEADDVWNEDAAPEALGAFDPSDSQQGLTREINAARLLRVGQQDAAHEVAERSAAQSILATDYYARQYGAHGLGSLAVDVDEFGFDPYVEERARQPLALLVERYFRVSVEGMERVPAEGRALFVVNRAGVLPWDALVLRTVLRTHRPELPSLRWLAEDDVIHYPFLGVFMNRLGAVRACPENAERLLERDRLVAVFPEGAQGSHKPYGERYRLQRFGRGGYIRLALKLGVPIFPTAVVGAEDVHPMLGRSRLLGRIFGTGSLPLTPTFPWLGALGLLPAPVKWRIVVGEPVDLSGYGPKAADDALVVHRLNEQVRGILQGLVDSARTKRGHALFR